MTARQVAAVLWEHFCVYGHWTMLSEVSASTGRSDGAHRAYRERRIDALLVRRSRSTPDAPKPPAAPNPRKPSGGQVALLDVDEVTPPPPPAPVDPYAGLIPDDGGLERIAIEIKVSRQDFLSDVRNPAKQAPWRELADRHAYAVPAGLVRLDEVPADSGLIEVWLPGAGDSGGREHFRWARKTRRTVTARPLPLPIVLDAFYRASRLEARARGYHAELGSSAGGDDPEALRVEIARLRHQLDLKDKQIEREVELREAWQKRYAAHGSPPCGTCGKPLRPTRGSRSRWDRRGTYGWEWDHTSEADHAACQAIRTAAARELEDNKEAPGDRYLWVPAPEPAEPDLAAAS